MESGAVLDVCHVQASIGSHEQSVGDVVQVEVQVNVEVKVGRTSRLTRTNVFPIDLSVEHPVAAGSQRPFCRRHSADQNDQTSGRWLRKRLHSMR